MKKSLFTALAAALAAALWVGWLSSAQADVPVSPEVSGIVQDWRVDSGYMVVSGVRYKFGPDFVLLSEQGQPLPNDSIEVGARVLFRSYDGVVETVVLVREGVQQ